MLLQSRLSLISYNIQAGVSTGRYSDYVTRSWQHVVPTPSRIRNLDGIARVISSYDIVGLQEIDTGGFRSGFINQARYLATQAGFPYRFDQCNRKVGNLTQHGNAVLTRIKPTLVNDYKLPGVIPGRGALNLCFGHGETALHIVIVHLSLRKRARVRQLDFLADLVHQHPYIIIMGDLNFRSDSREMSQFLEITGLREPKSGLHTFPSWQPTRQLDHILVAPAIQVEKVSVLPHIYSDHLPVAMQILLPEQLLTAA